MIINYVCLSSCFPNVCSAACGVFDGSARGSILAAHLLSLYVVGNITQYKNICHQLKYIILSTKDFRPSSASKKLVVAFLWSAKGEMS